MLYTLPRRRWGFYDVGILFFFPSCLLLETPLGRDVQREEGNALGDGETDKQRELVNYAYS